MLISEEKHAQQITFYSGHSIRINQELFEQSCIITPDKVYPNWPPRTINEIKPSHLEIILTIRPTLFLLGSGGKTEKAPDFLTSLLQQANISLEVMNTAAACRTYNLLCMEKIAAALLIESR